MIQKTEKFKILINKLAGKTFSNKEKAFLILVFFVLSGLCLYYFKVWSNVVKLEDKIIKPTVPNSITDPSPEASEQIKQTIKETASMHKKSDIRDPFLASKDSTILKTPSENNEQVIDLNLKGILWDKLVPSAIINSKVVKIGDMIFGKTVVDIEPDKVILMENGEIHILKLKKK
ncbi:MAG: hypothetical protein L6416_10435 [Candidatus Omnitrophica bacterium]|nr:hypothetical protein [Candidatus Omnitrophota bacterium]